MKKEGLSPLGGRAQAPTSETSAHPPSNSPLLLKSPAETPSFLVTTLLPPLWTLTSMISFKTVGTQERGVLSDGQVGKILRVKLS